MVKSSKCFYAVTKEGEVVGFARVLTDSHKFASLWDVVVDVPYRGKNIAYNLMFKLFNSDSLKDIDNWILFTDTASGLYQKFGFCFC